MEAAMYRHFFPNSECLGGSNDVSLYPVQSGPHLSRPVPVSAFMVCCWVLSTEHWYWVLFLAQNLVHAPASCACTRHSRMHQIHSGFVGVRWCLCGINAEKAPSGKVLCRTTVIKVNISGWSAMCWSGLRGHMEDRWYTQDIFSSGGLARAAIGQLL